MRDGKGKKDRVTMLPDTLRDPLRKQLRHARQLHQRDCEAGCGTVYLPDALERKYPGAARAWKGKYVFPSEQRSRDPRSGTLRRHHRSKSAVQNATKRAVQRAGLTKKASPPPFRHSFAPTSWRAATTSAPFSSSSGTKTSSDDDLHPRRRRPRRAKPPRHLD